jgi:glucokinase
MTKETESLFAVGVDIGGSHITTAIIDLVNRCVVNGSESRAPVNAQAAADEILNVWFDTIECSVQKAPVPIQRIGIAMPGPFDYTGGVSLIKNMHKYDALYGLNIKNILAKRLHVAPSDIQIRNDAEAFLAGEVMGGAARGYDHIVGITLGTGLGSAKSHFAVTEDVNLGSSLFKEGIAEDYISTRWFVKRYKELTGQRILGVKETLERGEGDAIVAQLVHEFSENLALFLQDFIRTEKAEIVVIGGNIANAFDLFYPLVRSLLRKDFDHVIIKKASLGEAAALIGAAGCWMPVALAEGV